MKNVYMPCTIDTKDCTPDQLIFWKKFENKVEENGNPFFFNARTFYAHINVKMSRIVGDKYCLCVEYVPRKYVFRIGIYIADGTKARVWDFLQAHRYEIMEQLNLPAGYFAIWCDGEKNPNTKRIQTELALYKDTNRDDLIDEALPIIMRYLEVFPRYLPNLF